MPLRDPEHTEQPLDHPIEPLLSGAPAPQTLSRFIGRARETRMAMRLLTDPSIRLLTITGPSGVGKTRFAQHLLERLDTLRPGRETIVWVTLSATEPGGLVGAIAAAIDVGDGGSGSLVDGVRLALQARPVLLVLDTVEHLSEAGPLLYDLLLSCPQLRCLVTSTTPVRVTGEQLFRLQPLTLPAPEAVRGHRIGRSDAVQLFVARAAAIDPSITLTSENEETIAAICRKLDGLPLAIELAAARVELFPLADLLDRLDRRLPLLVGGATETYRRHRTLREAIGWSYDLLDPEQQRCFRWLSVFSGGFSLETAERFCASVEFANPMLLISQLLDASLLQAQHADRINRLGMLETVREFGLEQLAEAGELEGACAAHAGAMEAFILEAEPHLYPSPEMMHWLQLVETDLENIRQALRWYETHQPAICARLVNALGQFWHRLSMLRESREWSERLLARTDLPAPQRRGALVDLARVMNYQFDVSRPEVVAEAIASAIADDDRVTLSDALTVQAMTALLRRDHEGGLPIVERAQAVAGTLPAPLGAPRQATLAVVALMMRAALLDGAAGVALLEPAIVQIDSVGDGTRAAMLIWTRAAIEQRAGETDRAVRSIQDVIARYRPVRERWSLGIALGELASWLLESDPAMAAQLAGCSARILTLLGLDDRGVGFVDPRVPRAASFGAMSPEDWCRAFDAGKVMGYDAGLDLALSIGQSEPVTRPGNAGLPARPTPERRLTTRERQVLELIVLGRSDREIALQLGISYRTTTTFVTAILRKLDVTSRAAAAAWAVRHQIESPA